METVVDGRKGVMREMGNSFESLTGVIGKSGVFFSCDDFEHIETGNRYPEERPFVCCYPDAATFDDFYTCARTVPTVKQAETLIDWRAHHGFLFEDIVDCHREPWEVYLNGE